MANIPIIGRRRERRAAELEAAIEDAVSKRVATNPGAVVASGATYAVNPSDPFAQSGGAFEANPLPRPPGDFNSLFGPGFPLYPSALDPLSPSGRAEARRYQYDVTTNVQIGQFGAPWTLLRQIASEVDVVARCIQLVQDAIGGMQWSFGFSNQIINQIRLENDEPNSAKATAIARDKYGEELTRTQKFWERPDERMGYTFSQWLNLAVWANLVYDGIVITPSYTLGGDLHSLSLIDTSHIKILLDNQGFLPQPPAPAYQQILYGFPRSEFQAEDIDALGNIPNGYRADQLSYYIQRPRLHTPYGFSTVEECINIATLYQQRQEWMQSEWSHGVTPKGVIKTTGTEGWTPEQFAYFQQATNDQWSGQTQRRQQVMVLRPGMEWDQLKDFAELYKTDFEEWCVLQIGAKFGVPQQQLGIPQHSFARSGAQNQTSMDLADRYAIDALVNHLINCINDLTRRYMGTGPEITITATSGNSDDSDYQRAQADASDVNNAIRTTNEIRAERGLPLISDKEADVLRATAGNAVIFFPGQLAYQEATERAVLEGTLAAADPEASTPSQADQNKSPVAAPSTPNDGAPAAPKSKSNVAETKNRSIGHVTTGSDMVTPGTDRKARASRAPSTGAPQPSSDAGSFTEKELSQFLKFAKARFNGNKSYRVFEFHHVDRANAAILNNAAYEATLDDVQSLVTDIRDNLAKTTTPVAAGLAVVAADSGRTLMLQRALDDDDPASGDIEWPGGHLEPGETPYDAACREWQEETGSTLPDGQCTNSWLSPDGIYELFTYQIAQEADVAINMDTSVRHVLNPDDPDGDCPEVALWMEPADLPGNPQLRAEVTAVPFSDITRTTAKSIALVSQPTSPPSVEEIISKTAEIVTQRLRSEIAHIGESLEINGRLRELEKSRDDRSGEIHIHNEIEMPAPPLPTPMAWPDRTSTGDPGEDMELRKNELLISLLDQRDQAEYAAKSQANIDMVIQTVAERLGPDFERLGKERAEEVTREFIAALGKSKQDIHVHVPEQPAPVVNVAAPKVNVDATSTHTHNVAAPEVTVNPTIKVPKADVTVNVPPPQPKNSKISRDADGNVIIERSND